MFYLYQSNRLERLFEALCAIIASPLSDPLVPEEIVVQNPGTARWLSGQIAWRNGIAANCKFPLPGRFIWQVFASQLNIPDDVQDFTRQALLWRLFTLLGKEVHRPEFAEIQSYLQDDDNDRKLFQLAGRIADLFDQYLVYRPDILTAWEAGDGLDWQALLWRQITASGTHHRAGLLQSFMEKYGAGLFTRAPLPERILVFGVSTLAPAYLEVIHAASTVVDVHLFHLSPCRSYWFDLVSDKAMARKRSSWRRKNLPDVSGYYETGNTLLSSLGTVGQEFSRQLGELDVLEEELYENPSGDSVLSCLQKDILDLADHAEQGDKSWRRGEYDRSVQFHICHSRIREIQVLHDGLLGLFEENPDLRPGDILVMAPDIEAYDSAVRAVFDRVEQERFIPWSLADRSVRGEQPLAEAFLALFELLAGRFEAPAVIAFLENESVLRRFAIDEAGISIIRTWVRESGIRWGIDSDHRQEYGYAMSDLHSWNFGLRRMLLGFIAGAKAEMFQGIAPFSSLSAGESILLGKLCAFFDRLQTWSERLRTDKTIHDWVSFLYDMLDDFFASGNSEGDLNTLLGLRETIDDWQENCRAADVTGTISLSVLKSHFTEILSGKIEGQAFLSGRVTFCNMIPMRSVPFAVIWLLGMNDTDYPRNQRPAAFDLISQNPRLGDRNRRNDDCYLFLEALISARKVFSVSWVGRDQQDNSVRSPSVVVISLLDYLKKQGYLRVEENFSPPGIEHPLQPFSSRCFDGNATQASYAAEWFPGGAPSASATFLAERLPTPGDEWYGLDFQQLVRFWSHPVQYFLRERLGLALWEKENLLPDKEPFQTDALDRYFLTHEITNDLLQGRNVQDKYVLFQACGRLPHGSFGRKIFEEIHVVAAEFVASLQPLAGEPRDEIEVDLMIDRFHLSGWVHGLHETGLVRFRSAALKSKDLLRLWVEHLVYNLVAPNGYNRRSCHVATDTVICLRPVADPLAELRRLLNLYWQGLQEPLRFYARTSQACYLAREKEQVFDHRRTWNSGFKYSGEGEDAAYRIAFKGIDPFAQPFADNAIAVYEPLYRHMEDVDAGV